MTPQEELELRERLEKGGLSSADELEIRERLDAGAKVEATGGEAPVSTAEQIARAAAQGASFGTADELVAQARAYSDTASKALPKSLQGRHGGTPESPGLPFVGKLALDAIVSQFGKERSKPGYERHLTGERRKLAQTPTAVRLPAEMAGALMTGGTGALGSVSRAPTIIGKSLAGAGIGALAGSAYGFGAGEGGVGNRAKEAAATGLVGGTVGAALPFVAGGARALKRKMTGRGLNVAERKLLKNLRRDQVTPEQFGPRLSRLGPEGMPVDAGGQNVRQMGAAVVNVPGRGQNIGRARLMLRDQGEGRRIHEGIKSIVSGEDYTEAFDALVKAHRTAADNALEPILQHGAVKSTTLRQLMKRSDLAQEVINRVKKDVSMAGVDETDIRFVHEVYKEVNAMLRTARRAGDGGMASRLGKLKDAMRPELVKEVPGYGKYLKDYASGATMKDAMEAGTKAMRAEVSETRKFMRKATEDQRDAFRIGAAKAISDIVDNTPVTAAGFKRLFSRPVMRQRIRALFPAGEDGSKEYRAFRKVLLREAKFRESHEAANVGSRTTPLAESIKDLQKFPAGEIATEAALDMNPGVTLARGAMNAARSRRGPSAAKAAREADVLFANTPEAKADLVRRLISEVDQDTLNSIIAILQGGSLPLTNRAAKEARGNVPLIPY